MIKRKHRFFSNVIFFLHCKSPANPVGRGGCALLRRVGPQNRKQVLAVAGVLDYELMFM